MGYEKLELLIGGEWTPGTAGRSDPVINPATEEVLGEVPHASPQDLDRALEASLEGFKTWSCKSAFERQDTMERSAELLSRRKEALAHNLTLEMGKPLAESRVEIEFVINVLRWYGEEGKRAYGRIVPARPPGVRQLVTKEPIGPVAAFAAWNFPGTNVIRKIAGALGAGCSIIIKASEETPATCVAIARCFQEAGLPAGVLNVVFGVPDAVSRHLLASSIPRKVSFTGSVAVGKHLQKLSAETLKRCTMELGGHAPFIVFNDAKFDKAVEMAVASKFRNAGQVCLAPSRFYIQEGVYDQFVDAFVDRAKALVVGNGVDDGVNMGPLVSERRLSVMEDFVSDARQQGGEVVIGGDRIGNRGYFFAPTVIRNVPDQAALMMQEPFGPVAAMTTFREVDEVVERANSLEFGLAAYAFTNNGALAARLSERLDVGMVGINHCMVSTPETPLGGVKESGYGSEGGVEGLDAYLRTKFVTELDA